MIGRRKLKLNAKVSGVSDYTNRESVKRTSDGNKRNNSKGSTPKPPEAVDGVRVYAKFYRRSEWNELNKKQKEQRVA